MEGRGIQTLKDHSEESYKGEGGIKRPVLKSFEFKGQSEGVQRTVRQYQDSRKALQLQHHGIWKDRKPG